MYRTVLVHVDDTAGSDERIHLAVELARQYDGVLIGMAAGIPRLPIELYAGSLGVVAMGPEYSEIQKKEIEAEFGTAATRFQKGTEGAGVETEWRTAFDAPSSALIHAASAADIVVVGTGENSLMGDFRTPSAGDILLHTGRPILVVPPGCDKLNPRHIVVAWKDTQEARRAIADALPFMARAERVTLVEVEEDDAQTQLADAKAFVVRHGIAANTARLKKDGTGVDDQILEYAAENGADLIVAGAYGHTRLREWAFGGVTRGLLTRCRIPCMLSH